MPLDFDFGFESQVSNAIRLDVQVGFLMPLDLGLKSSQVSNAIRLCGGKNHSTQDSRVVPHRGTNWAALRLTAQIRRDAVLTESYGRGCQ